MLGFRASRPQAEDPLSELSDEAKHEDYEKDNSENGSCAEPIICSDAKPWFVMAAATDRARDRGEGWSFVTVHVCSKFCRLLL